MVEHRQNRGLDPAPVGPLCGPVQLPRSNGGGKVAPGSEREGALGSVRLRVNRHAWTGVCAGLAGRIGARGWVGPRNRTGGWHARNRHGPRRALARAWAPTAAAGSPHTPASRCHPALYPDAADLGNPRAAEVPWGDPAGIRPTGGARMAGRGPLRASPDRPLLPGPLRPSLVLVGGDPQGSRSACPAARRQAVAAGFPSPCQGRGSGLRYPHAEVIMASRPQASHLPFLRFLVSILLSRRVLLSASAGAGT